MIWVVVPCHREKQIPWVFDNFKRQKYEHKKLCIIENGDAIGGCERHGLKPNMIVKCPLAQVSIVRNWGIQAIGELHDDSWMAFWDDDDWYGPGYLSELAELAQSNKADVYGKHRHFVAFPDNGLHLFNAKNANSYAQLLHGPSLFFRPIGAVEFQIQPEAEEFRWCVDMTRKGAKIWACSIHHLLYLRYKSQHDHAWVSSDAKVAAASVMDDAAYWLGPVDLSVVSGDIDWHTKVIQQAGRSNQIDSQIPQIPPPIWFNSIIMK